MYNYWVNIVKALDSATSIPAAFFGTAEQYPDRVVYSQAYISDSSTLKPEERERKYHRRTYKEVSQRIRKLASYLVNSGFKAGDKAAIISNSRCEWMEADIAILSAGGVSVSVYPSLLAPDIAYIFHDSGTKVVFAENEEQVKKLREIESKEFDLPEIEGRAGGKIRFQASKVVSFEKCDLPGCIWFEDIVTGDSAEELAFTNLSREDLAALVYTSGTTGPPKGVIQTHGNHLSNIRQAYQAGMYNEKSALLCVLPLAHSFAKLIGYICFLTSAEALFPAVTDKKTSKLNPESLTADIGLCGANIFPLVPRMLEKMKEGIERKSQKKNFLGTLIRHTLKSKHPVYNPIRRLIKKKLFGKNFTNVISGGAKLPVNIAEFFESLGMEVLEGYGLTETCVATNVNRHGLKKIGTVGPVLAPDIEMTLSEEGEILFRGPNISKGYINRPEATKASWDSEGRFHTGDLGSIDADGYLTITGRKKELIVTAGGKKVAPEGIENKIKTIRFISHAVMVGEGKPYCAALVTVNFSDARKHHDPAGGLELEDFLRKLHESLWKEIEVLNKTLASFESIKKIQILHEDFTIDNGLLTPTLKVKRNEVTKRFKDLIEKMYSS